MTVTARNARREGFLLGLKRCHTMLCKARNYQAQKQRKTNGDTDPDVKAEHEHTANVLHDLCLRLQSEIKKAS